MATTITGGAILADMTFDQQATAAIQDCADRLLELYALLQKASLKERFLKSWHNGVMVPERDRQSMWGNYTTWRVPLYGMRLADFTSQLYAVAYRSQPTVRESCDAFVYVETYSSIGD